MGRNHKTADAVIVWLGNGDNPVTMEGDRFNSRKARTAYQAAKAYKRTSKKGDLVIALQNEYFGGLWVVQEFLLARHVRLLIKDEWVLDNENISALPNPHTFTGIDDISLALWFMLSDRSRNQYPQDLERVIQSYSKNACVDPRDKVYGLLGLVDPDEYRIHVDYSKLPQEVLMDAVLAIFVNDHRSARRGDLIGMVLPKSSLAVSMGCSLSQSSSLYVLMETLCSEVRLLCFIDHDFPISAMGFDQADGTQGSVDRWWFDFQGQRYFAECTVGLDISTFHYNPDPGPEPSFANLFNDKTRQLLSENWEKYVPRVEPAEIDAEYEIIVATVQEGLRSSINLT